MTDRVVLFDYTYLQQANEVVRGRCEVSKNNPSGGGSPKRGAVYNQ